MTKMTNLDEIDAWLSQDTMVQFMGKQFNVGYLPAGVSIPILVLFYEMVDEENKALNEERHESYIQSQSLALMEKKIKLVSLFTSFYEPELTYEKVCLVSKKKIDVMFTLLVKAILAEQGLVGNQSAQQTPNDPSIAPKGSLGGDHPKKKG